MITPETREYRTFAFDIKDEEMKAQGVPVVFDRETVIYKIDNIEYKEKVDSKAFDGVDLSDVVFNIDHAGKPAAKTRNGTLALEVKSDGVYMNADLSKNATGRELYEDIKNGFYDRMSFAFTVEADEYNREEHMRTITKVGKLIDVSAVTFPAYKQTSISARSFFEAEAEKEQKAKELAEEQRRRRLKLLAEI